MEEVEEVFLPRLLVQMGSWSVPRRLAPSPPSPLLVPSSLLVESLCPWAVPSVPLPQVEQSVALWVAGRGLWVAGGRLWRTE